MKKKITLLLMVTTLILSLSPKIFADTYVTHGETQIVANNIEPVIANAKGVELINEVQSVDARMKLINPDTRNSEVRYLLEKYDGADFNSVGSTSDWNEHVQDGGMNCFGYTKKGLDYIRSDASTAADLCKVGGATAGAAMGGLIGVIIGAAGGSVISGHLSGGASIMAQWIQAGSTKGGCRITLTDHFPIDSVNSQTSCKVRKL